MKQNEGREPGDHDDLTPLTPLTVKVPADLYRAYQRCTWILVNETGRDQLDIMEELVRDFLVKHGC